jgi:calcium/calmodulin-dependent protein kinase I
MLTPPQEALKHRWLSGHTATEHNLLPEIRAYMAKARLRRGIEIVKLANRIEALKMQEDENDEVPGESDVPADAKAAAGAALSAQGGEDVRPGLSSSSSAGSAPGGKRSLSNLAKGAIFREVVLAKVREMKEVEKQLQVEKDAEENAKRKSWTGEGS